VIKTTISTLILWSEKVYEKVNRKNFGGVVEVRHWQPSETGRQASFVSAQKKSFR